MEIKRDRYLRQLIESRQNGSIKVVTGIRRCGKSYLLNVLFYHYLLDSGVTDDHIIRVDLEDRINKELRNPDAMLHYVHDRIKDKNLYYIIIDEVQLMDEFVDVLNSFRHIENADTYVTGSNSHFLSSDIPTEFRGRGETIHVNPLSFSEFYSAVGGDKQDAWREYYTYGGLPLILSFGTEQKKVNYLKNLFETVYLADIVERHKVKNDNELRELVLIMASSIDAPCNPTKLSNTFKSVKNVSIGSQTISNYLTYLSESFLLNKAIRYDIKGKKYTNTLSKYYFSDIGLRNAILDMRQQEETHIMENVIYNELVTRGYSVDVGVVEIRKPDKEGKWSRTQLEVDFIASLGSKKYYVQSALSIPDREKEIQESRSLTSINDSFKKIIVVKDHIMPRRNEEGILTIGLFDFLLKENSLDM
ncbi:ATP-binding protein [uncultured Prevotella sp.]|uniref:ATP-binding protein n=1 Tax=uncultured Prevotella sp. TaxID=159272 RepID=UPI002604A506|nr:ATP-binding protein [uncultured Prevotella sp.]